MNLIFSLQILNYELNNLLLEHSDKIIWHASRVNRYIQCLIWIFQVEELYSILHAMHFTFLLYTFDLKVHAKNIMVLTTTSNFYLHISAIDTAVLTFSFSWNWFRHLLKIKVHLYILCYCINNIINIVLYILCCRINVYIY